MKIIASFALSADGRISPPVMQQHVGFQRFSSDEDMRHLRALRDEVDAVLVGGKTFRAYPKAHKRESEYTEFGLKKPLHHVILSSGSHILKQVPADSPLFSTVPLPPVTLAVGSAIPEDAKRYYPESVQWLALPEKQPEKQLVACILEHLAKQGIERLLLEGGGQVLALFLAAGQVHELALTVCPVLFGQTNTTALLPALGLAAYDPGIRLKLLSCQPVGDEVFLRYAVS